MKKLNITLAVIGLILFIGLVLTAYIPNWITLKYGILAVIYGIYLLLVPVSFITGIIYFARSLIKDHQLRWGYFSSFGIILTVTLLILLVGTPIYNSILLIQFENHFTQYVETQRNIETGHLDSFEVSSNTTERNYFLIPSKQMKLQAHSINVIKKENGQLEIDYSVNGIFTLPRQGFMYLSDNKPDNNSYYAKKIKNHWYKYNR